MKPTSKLCPFCKSRYITIWWRVYDFDKNTVSEKEHCTLCDKAWENKRRGEK